MTRITTTILLLGLSACGGSAFSAAEGDAGEAGDDGGTQTDAGRDTSPAPEAGHDASDAAPDAMPTEAGCPCVSDLSNIGNADFFVQFTVSGVTPVRTALVEQRAECSAGLPFWAVYTSAVGVVGFEIGGGADDALNSTVTIANGQSHTVLTSRVSGVLTVQVDGQTTQSAQPLISLGQMPALAVGTDPACAVAPLAGSLTKLCISTPCRGSP